MILAFILAAAVLAASPPPEEIPWDSALVVDTILIPISRAGDRVDTFVTDGYWVFFITREKYELEVLGYRSYGTKDVSRNLDKIKALLGKPKK